MNEWDIDFLRLQHLPLNDLQPLIVESRAQGFEFLDRLVNDYLEGTNQFDQPGEALFGVYNREQMIAIGGLNRDPYVLDSQTGRVRRVYVLSSWRRQGVGRVLVEHIIAEAKQHFHLLTLRTVTDQASKFYCALGFQIEPEVAGASHHLVLERS